MRLTVEDGSGIPDSNSYITEQDAADNLPSRYMDDWTGMEAGDRADRLVAASRFVDAAFEWVGRRKTLDQGMAWPRTGAAWQGHPIPDDAVPRAVTRACVTALVTVLIDGFEAFRSTGEQAVQKESFAPMSVTYFEPAEKAGYRSAYDDVNNILRGLYETGQRGVIAAPVARRVRPRQAKALVARFLRKYGRKITWRARVEKTNSRGIAVAADGEETERAAALLLKERFSPLDPKSGLAGLTQDYARYVLALPDVALQRDMVIADDSGMRWRLGIVDWFDVGGVTICKQASLTPVADGGTE